MQKVIASNCAGTFSGFLSQLSWMHHLEYEKSLEVLLHSSNKTRYQGNSLSNYTSLKSENPLSRDEMQKPNMLMEIFSPNQYLNYHIPNDFIYVENYPVEFSNLLTRYEIDQIPYHGRGGSTGAGGGRPGGAAAGAGQPPAGPAAGGLSPGQSPCVDGDPRR